jgi:putative peptidoglycan lipid II flippase
MRRRLFANTDSLNRKIFRTAVVVGLFTLVVKACATAKELVVARSFGRSDELDALLIAYLLPAFVLGLLNGAFATAIIPALVGTREKQGPEAAQELFSGAMLVNAFLLAGTAILLGLLAPVFLPYLGSGFTAAKLHLTRQLLCVLLPFVVFGGLAGAASAVLNAVQKFALPAVVPLCTPLLTILFIVVGAARLGAFVLAAGLTIGSVIEAGLLVWLLQRHGMSLRLRWTGFTPEIRGLMGQYVPMLAGAFLTSSTGVVDQSMAAMLPSGSVAALGYGNKIVTLVLAIGGSSLSTAFFPHLSTLLARNDWDQCRDTLRKYSLLLIMATLPLTAFLVLFSRTLVGLLYQRGAFTAADANLVSKVQIAYALQIPFNFCGLLMVRFLSAVRRNDVLMYLSGINLVLDIVLNLVFMRRWGVAGIAFSTSLVYAFSCLFVTAWSLWLIRRQPLEACAVGEAGSEAGPGAVG